MINILQLPHEACKHRKMLHHEREKKPARKEVTNH